MMVSTSERSRKHHLDRVARSAGEAFAYTPVDEAQTPPRRSYTSAVIWLTLGGIALIGLAWI